MTNTNPRDLIQRLADGLDGALDYTVSGDTRQGLKSLVAEARAYLDQPEPVPVSADAAFAIGQTGGPPSEVERLAFEAWMRGHSWGFSGEWNGTTYVGTQEWPGWADAGVVQTRMLWAAWRDRAFLAR
jgi:hypothetical protein